MSTTSRTARFTMSTPAAVAARALAAALLAAAVTFGLDHAAPAHFGLLVLGAYLLLQAVVLAVGAPALAWSRVGRGLVLLRVLVSLVGGVVAFSGADGGIDVLRPLEALVFLLVGAAEVVGGLRRSERADLSGDAVVVGGLQVLVGLLLIILNSDPLFAVGVLAAWGAIVAVYLGISAANLRRREARG